MGTEDATEPEPLLTALELVERYQQAVPQLSLMCIEAKRGIEEVLQHTQDVRVRRALRQQQLMWETQTATLGMMMVLLELVAGIHEAVGVSVTRQ